MARLLRSIGYSGRTIAHQVPTMLTALTLLIATISLASAILGIASFVSLGWKRRNWWLFGSLIGSAVLVGLVVREEQRKADLAVAQERRHIELQKGKDRQDDANRVAGSITVSGWENEGDCLAYLAVVAGFYPRHVEVYPQEADQTKKEYTEWSQDLRRYRQEGKAVPFDVSQTLKGLVGGHQSRLYQIGKRD